MAVKIEIANRIKDANTSECKAAHDLKLMLEQSIAQNISGNISIAYSLTLCGQKVRDIDLFMWGKLENYVLKDYYTNDVHYPKKDLQVDSFCIAIELKEHRIEDVEISDTNVYVSYKNQLKNATEQNEKQRYALISYLGNEIQYKPTVTNFIWLKSISSDQLKRMQRSNKVAVLPNIFSFKQVVEMLMLQGQKPYFASEEKRYKISVGEYNDIFYKDINDCLFSSKAPLTGLTKKRIEILQQQKVDKQLENINIGESQTIFKGKAGTGKTFKLLQSALRLANPDTGVRCLLLTYNHALVSDIRRLLHFMDIPDGIDNYTVQIQTLHSFFMQLMKTLDIDTSKIYGTQFETQYQLAIENLSFTVDQLLDDKELKTLKEDNKLAIDWDYILVDEAQDWFQKERDILYRVYGSEHIIVADGESQFMRNAQHLHWGTKSANICKEVIGMRQKNNLVSFVSILANEMGLKWDVKPNPSLNGGQVIIRNNYKESLHHELMDVCKIAGCENYDILFLIPYQMKPGSQKSNTKLRVIDLDLWRKNGIILYDGTSDNKRKQYPTEMDECRLFQYESCRGLEGWVTVCFNLDILAENKFEDFKELDFSEDLDLGSNEEKLRKYVHQWILMPLTRPIDTLVITLNNPDSEIGRILKKVYEKCKDYVRWEVK